tara:strand:- start:2981 stop:4483 length:1503 start_codon:yes stop_codon:yes gene_type:complete
MGIKLQGGNSSSNLANVNSLQKLEVVMPMTGITGAGFVQLSSQVDAGDDTGYRTVLPLEASDDYRLRVGRDQTLFNATFEGTVVATNLWFNSSTTFTNAQVNGYWIANSASVNTSSATSYLRTWRHFPTFGTYPTYVDMWIREANYDAVNAISEWGFLFISNRAVQQVDDGIYFRRTSGGELFGVVTTNAIDMEVIPLLTKNIASLDGVGLYTPTKTNHYLITLHNDVIHFWINDVLVGEILCPASQPNHTGSSNLPVGFRVFNTSTSSTPRQLSVGFVNVSLGDQNTNKPWSHAMSGSGGGSYQTQQGNAVGPTVVRGINSSGHPTSGTGRIAGLWGTATSTPALNSLGGLWTSPAISTITTEADYPIFAYLNPAGSATLPGKTLYVTGIRIGDASVTTVAATNPMFLSYIVMVEASSATTSTADAATTTSGKSTVIGGHGFGATDAVGTMKPGFTMDFTSPLVVPAGKYLTVVVRPFGTVTLNTLVVSGSVAVNGYFE